MRTFMRVCRTCRAYTLRDTCPKCGAASASPIPPRYSPEDRHGKYRRLLKKEGGNGWKASS
ncbi:MAG TPA: RNA-protein complex protein Nop10 [Thermoplasmata archaeon]|nr:RNA-protein complex protein Nop10 [Thermoplasmata archaeon]